MRILFDHGTPKGLSRMLQGHAITTAKTRGWEKLTNGALLQIAEQAGFDLLITTDKNLRYQQNITGRKIAILALGNPELPTIRRNLDRILEAVALATPGSYRQLEMSR